MPTPDLSAAAPRSETPTRSLPLAGASNFRDLGGYTGHGGRQVTWRRIFRSDHLASLTPDDQARLAALGIARTVDFRGERERAQLAYLLPAVEHYQLAIEPTVVQRAIELQRDGRALTAQDAVGLMQETYRGFVHENAPRFAEFFRILLAKDTPLVFHCTAGKDRTGFASALLLTLLGVQWDDVMADYLRTNDLWTGHIGRYPELDIDTRAAIIEARTPYLEAAFAVVRDDFGSPEAFAEKALGLDAAARERMKADLLE